MTEVTRLINEVQQYLSRLNLPTQKGQINTLAIGEQPANHDDLSTLLNQLLTEANLHLSETWAAHMTPAISSISLLGQLIAGLHNGNLLSPQLYPILAQLEQQTLDWLCRLFQQQYGHFMTGSSYANLEALWQAKQHRPKGSRIVYASRAAHYSIAKACHVLDLELIYIESNEHDQISIQALKLACERQAPLAIVATAGTPAAGAIDPLSDCIKVAKQFGAWSHIDAAWGGALRILPEYDSLFDDISLADSICFDPHKALSQPKPSSVVLYQHPLQPLLSCDSHYLEQTPKNSLPGSHGGETFLPLWLTIMSSGLSSVRQQLRIPLQQAERFAVALQQKSTWPVYPSSTGIICFETADNTDLDDLVKRAVISEAKLADKNVYRAVFSSVNTRADAIIAELERYF